MKAIRYYGPENLVVEETPPPAISAGEMLVRVKACGICATDVKTFRRGHPKIMPGAVLGHEIAGVIAEVKDVEGWKVGQRVTVAPYAPCGECDYCRRSQYTCCDTLMQEGMDPGGFAEFVRVPPRLVQKGVIAVPDNLPDEIASFNEPVACCFHGLEALQLDPSDTLLIIGDGPMGLLQSMVARVLGVGRVVISGMDERRLELARSLADVVIDARSEDVNAALRKVAPQGADKVMVSVGDPAIAESAFQYVRKAGAINIYAGMPKGVKIAIDPNIIHYDEVRLLGTFGFTPDNFKSAMEALATGNVDPTCVLSNVVDFDHIRQALDDAASYRGIRYVVQFP